MRAYQFTTTSPTLERNLTLNPRAPLPPTATSLAPSTVLVKVLAASLNAFDFKLPELRYLGRLAVGRPSVPCMDFAGRVVALGKETGLEVGDLVYGRLDGPTKFGTLAEYTVVPRAGCAKLPEGVSVVDGAAAGSVSYCAEIGGIGGGVGKKIFINGGSGGTGTFGIQIAKAMGCEVVTSCSTGNVGLCESLGADVVVDYKTQDVLAEVKRISGFDLVVDFVGTPGGCIGRDRRL
ncbi:uncharacterized protein KY384_001684 [Bacidia gigantensis]|uniref:uncharacterized protein n=1 Tax=Bacidia gigantensis TaxID=2732470 RepID=UPI001D04AB70|nr:uncharacterized protein KY384_001684 [Bacidia gigantensis]KAG8533943.1 hypothetical protein KY384_001684 [Bacidia gigantensis]